MSEDSSASHLDLLIEQMPADLQRAAMKLLSEWGYPLPGEDSFPVRLGLITRLQLWSFANTIARMSQERLEMTALLAEETELRKSLYGDFQADQSQSTQTIHTLADHLVNLQQITQEVQCEFFDQLTAFMQQAETIIRQLPSHEALDHLSYLRQSSDNLAATKSLRSSTARLLRAARCLERMGVRLEQMEARLTAPKPPPVAVPLDPATWRRRRAAAALVFLTTFIGAWAQRGGAFSAGLLAGCALAAGAVALCFLLYVATCEPERST